MLTFEVALSFFGIAVLLALAPGPDNVFVLMQSAMWGRKPGMLVVLGLAMGERLPVAPTAHGTAALIYLAMFGSIIGFGAYVWLLNHVRPALASSYAYVNPPIAVLLGAWLGNEHFSLHDLGALAVILVGVVVISRAKSRVEIVPPQATASKPSDA